MAITPNGAAEPPRLYKIAPTDSVDRSQYIGGSEVFKLFNEPFYGEGCARELAYEKVHTIPDVEFDPEAEESLYLEALYKRGHVLEDVFAKFYAEDTGRALLRRNRLVLHPNHPKAGVHTDRIITAHSIGDRSWPTGDCEIKTKSKGPYLNILRNGLPVAHSLQLQWSLWITGHLWGASIIGGCFEQLPYRHFDRERDPILMETFPRLLDAFWNGIEHGQLPPQLPDPGDLRCRVCKFRLTCRGTELEPEEYQRMLAELEGRRALKKIQNAELYEALKDRAILNGEIKDCEKAEHIVNQQIKELLGNEETAALVNGEYAVYLDHGAYYGLDQKRLKEEEPEIYKRYYIDGRPTGKTVLRVWAVQLGKKNRER